MCRQRQILSPACQPTNRAGLDGARLSRKAWAAWVKSSRPLQHKRCLIVRGKAQALRLRHEGQRQKRGQSDEIGGQFSHLTALSRLGKSRMRIF